MIKKSFFGLLAVLFLMFLWQVLKTNEYTITFRTKADVGTTNQTLKLWSRSLDKAKILNQNSINKITQQIQLNQEDYTLLWQFSKENDSITKVKIEAKKNQFSITNRLKIIFTDSKFENEIKSNITAFVEVLKQHLKNFKVEIKGESLIPEKFCAYIPVKTTQLEKAKGMMKTYGILDNAFLQNNVKLDGRPMVEITFWDIKTDSIYFNFCYPIVKQDSLPKHITIKYKKISPQKSIKAIYNGNYITSDRAWYQLIDYAKKNNLETINTPLEIFYNNPNMGGDALNWTTEIHLPVKN